MPQSEPGLYQPAQFLRMLNGRFTAVVFLLGCKSSRCVRMEGKPDSFQGPGRILVFELTIQGRRSFHYRVTIIWNFGTNNDKSTAALPSPTLPNVMH